MTRARGRRWRTGALLREVLCSLDGGGARPEADEGAADEEQAPQRASERLRERDDGAGPVGYPEAMGHE